MSARPIQTYLRRFAVPACLLLLAGCATLPQSIPVRDGEAEQVRQEFKTMLDEQRQCPAAVDTDVTVTVDNLLWSGTLSGYLRAMAPSYLRIEGVNPLGLTEAILAVDGENFTYVSVRNQQAYSGPLTAAKIASFAPDMSTAMTYYWLLGRIPTGALGIADVGLDQNGQGYWLDLHYSATDKRAMVLFDPARRLVKRHMVLGNSDAIAAELSYEYQPPAAKAVACQLPERLTISKQGNGLISLSFTKRYPTPRPDTAPFRVTPPPEYERIIVQ